MDWKKETIKQAHLLKQREDNKKLIKLDLLFNADMCVNHREAEKGMVYALRSLSYIDPISKNLCLDLQSKSI